MNRAELLTVYLCAATLSLEANNNNNNVLQQQTCSDQLRQIDSDDVTSEIPPRVTGLWTSQRCEVRPGPDYVLRQYRFYEGGLFDLRLFYYSDSFCQNSSHALTARGQLKPYQLSWIIPGAMELDYQLWHASVVPFTSAAAFTLRRKLRAADDRACAETVAGLPWQPFERRDVYNFVDIDDSDLLDSEHEATSSDVDCLDYLDISVHELQLVRVEQRRLATQNGTTTVDRSLLLGDIHTSVDQRPYYRPMGFQEPLVLHDTMSCNTVCDRVAKATEYFPPHLTPKDRSFDVQVQLPGSWVSRRCEARTYGVFVTRHFEFTDRKWIGRHNYFADITCQRRLYTVDTTGAFYVHQLPSDVVHDAQHIDFNITEISLTVHDKSTLRQLNQVPLPCGNSEWKSGQSQDITNTSGCPVIGILLAPTESDIIRLEHRATQSLLWLGQRPTDGSQLAGHDGRPTSFQPALIQCSTVDRKKHHSESKSAAEHQRQTQRVAGSSACTAVQTSVGLLLMSLLVAILGFSVQSFAEATSCRRQDCLWLKVIRLFDNL